MQLCASYKATMDNDHFSELISVSVRYSDVSSDGFYFRVASLWRNLTLAKSIFPSTVLNRIFIFIFFKKSDDYDKQSRETSTVKIWQHLSGSLCTAQVWCMVFWWCNSFFAPGLAPAYHAQCVLNNTMLIDDG